MNELTPKELFDALTKLYDRNAGLISDVKDAIHNLKITEGKLDAAKHLYEKKWASICKENFGKVCLSIITIIAIMSYSVVQITTKSNVSAESKDGKLNIYQK